MIREHYSRLTKTERRIFWTLLILAFMVGWFATTLLGALLNATSTRARIANAVPFFLFVIITSSAILIFYGKKEISTWLLLLSAITGTMLVVIQAEGYGFPAAFALLATTSFIPLQLLKGRQTILAVSIGILGTIAVILVDTFWDLPRIPSTTTAVITARIASGFISLLIIWAIATQFRDFSIRSKLLILALGTSLTSIFIVASTTTFFTQQALEANVRNSLTSAAAHSIEQLDSFISSEIEQVTANAQNPDVIEYLEGTPSEKETIGPEIEEIFESFIQSNPDDIGAYTLLDKSGLDVVDTIKSDIGQDKSRSDYFISPSKMGTAYVSPIYHVLKPVEPSFYIASPVFDENRNLLGVLVVRYRAAALQNILQANNGFAGEQSYGILLGEHNIVLASGGNSEWISKTLIQLDQSIYANLLINNRLPALDNKMVSLDATTFAQTMENATNGSYFSSADAAWGSPVEVGVAVSTVLPWKVAYVQPQSITRQVTTQQKQLVVITSLITGLLIALAGFTVANSITRPILGLAATAEQIAAGNTSARAIVNANDEVNTLAISFNLMTDRLKETLGSLERRVAERTADLETARLLSERRADELQSISEISRIISSEQRLETLLPLITRLVSEKFDLYHTGIFLIEDIRQFAVLQAANSEGGRRMLARGYRLAIGHAGLVGIVAQTGVARIALNVGTDAAYFNNPDLPGTHSEMALPLNLRGTTIGVLDVQSTKLAAFTETDAKTLSILADQIAITIDNARLFGENRQTLAEVQSLYNQYLRQEWSTFERQGTQIGYYKSLMGGRPLHTPVDSNEIQTALKKGTVVVVEGKDDTSLPAIVVPVRLRGQTIGVLNIKAPTPQRRWTREEINLAQAVSDRLALALDNARLLFESQRQTAKEQKIGEVTAKIGASINMQNVLQTAVEELGRALPGSEVVIQFTPSSS